MDASLALTGWQIFLFVICLIAVCGFEFINGFHDTANAVATVIYTRSLQPVIAVIWSGFWNFIGVYAGGVAVALGIIKLMPLADMANQEVISNIALILSILLSAIIWNLATWYFGIPCSSSHTLIGALIGGGIAFQYFYGGAGPNWSKASDIGLSLLLSPAFGFASVILLMFLLRAIVKNSVLFDAPKDNETPPWWIRGILITTCTLVSFFHGSNDGQKGVGLLMIILLTFMPAYYALNPEKTPETLIPKAANLEVIFSELSTKNPNNKVFESAKAHAGSIKEKLVFFDKSNVKQQFALRKEIQGLGKDWDNLKKDPDLVTDGKSTEIAQGVKELKSLTDYAPLWAIIMISLSLGVGTMIGWKRIVVTVGEKIGKTHLTYAQGAAAEIVAASTIGLSTGFGLPVSTTHVLSSGIAGSMVAANGVKNLQKSTIVNIGIAWLLTLPVTIFLSAAIYFIAQFFINL